MKNKFYITTAIAYTNAEPHIGFALELLQADVLARYHRLIGDETYFLTGTDEHGSKIAQAAEKHGKDTQVFVDEIAETFIDLTKKLNISNDDFIRTSDQKRHWPAAQKIWRKLADSGDLYKKSYSGLYCVGCESFKHPKELVEGKCPEHLKKPDVVEEKNYFFRLSKYQEKLIQLIESGEFKITPENKKNETLSFIKSGLEDFSVSRSNERAKGVGVPVPGDDAQKIYVWFDALNIYMTGVGFGWNEETWEKWWPADLHIIGKDINRFHTVYWPAMLLSAGVSLPKEVLVHSFINAPGGQKMSKSLGNVVDPFELSNQFGLEGLRYYLLSQIPTEDDGEISLERLKEVYTSDLANGLGNLVSRVAKLCENNNSKYSDNTDTFTLDLNVEERIKEYHFNEALEIIWGQVGEADKLINEREILNQFSGQIKASTPLFPRV